MKEVLDKTKNNLWLVKWFFVNLITFIAVALIFHTGLASAESGSVTISALEVKTYNLSSAGAGIALASPLQNLIFNNANYNQISYFEVKSNAFSFSQPSGTSKFYCTSGGSCTGTFAYLASSNTIKYWFDDTAYLNLTGSVVSLGFNTSAIINEVDIVAVEDGGVPSSTQPIGLYYSGAGGRVATGTASIYYIDYTSIVAASVTNRYNVTYSQANETVTIFSVLIDKYQASVNTQVHINGSTSKYYSEPTLNKVNFTSAFTYNDGIFLAFCVASGECANVNVNTTGAGLPEPVIAPGSQIGFNFSGLNAYKGTIYGIDWSLTSFNPTNFYFIESIRPDESVAFSQQVTQQSGTTGNFYSFDSTGIWYANISTCTFVLVCLPFTTNLIDSDPQIVSDISDTNFTITTDKTAYSPGDNIIITATNPSTASAYITAFGMTGIITEIAWNKIAPANSVTVINKVLPNYLPAGNYTVNIATTSSYYPIVAQAKFNISLPSNTSNTLSVLWDDSIYLLGKIGTVYTTTNFNASTLDIISPSGTTSQYPYPANSTNTTSAPLNEVGLWKARLIDSGNTSNLKYANVSVTKGNPTDNETILLCTSAKDYVCWDKPKYFRNSAFTLSLKISSFTFVEIASLRPYIEVTDPNNIVISNKSVNLTHDENANAFQGTSIGQFGYSATPGIYIARLKNVNILGNIDTLAESAAELLQTTSSDVVPTPQIPTGTTAVTSLGSNLLYLISTMFFWGLMLLLGFAITVYSGKFPVKSHHGLAVLAFAFLETLGGLFSPYTIPIFVVLVIIIALTFRKGQEVIGQE